MIERKEQRSEDLIHAAVVAKAPLPHVAYYYLSEVLDRPVRRDGEKRPFGSLHDIGAGSAAHYPTAVSLEVKVRGGNLEYVPWASVLAFSRREIVVKPNGGPPPAADFLLRRDVLDDQVVDVGGAKVVRVNDVHLVHAQGQLIMGHVDVGLLGILRRLGWAKAVAGLLKWLLDYEIEERFVTWRHVQVILPGASPGGLKLSSALKQLADRHPADIADIIEDLGLAEGRELFEALPAETAVDAFEELDENVQRAFIAQEEPGRAADILEEMPANEAAAVLRDVHDADAERIISRMDSEAAEDVREILSHEEGTAGGIMATACLEASPEEEAGALLDRIHTIAEEIEVFYYVYVLDEARRLVGVLNLRELLRASKDAVIRDLMNRDAVTVPPDASHRDVAELLVKYGFRAIPVVDEWGVFLGAVRIFKVADLLMPGSRD